MDNEVVIKQIPVGSYQVHTYLVACPSTKRAVIIDPAGEAEKLLALIEEEGVRVEYILNTHGHADHVLANRQLKEVLSVPVCMHAADDRFFSDNTVRQESEKELGLPAPEPADKRLQDGDVLEVGKLRIEVIHTPGHTPGSVCFRVGDNLFTGDTLFVGDVGRTDLTGGSLDMLLESLAKRVIVLPKETKIWPGHDYGDSPSSTIGREMEENPYITDFILSD